MTPIPSRSEAWFRLVDGMLAELRTADPRAEIYWAHQVAYGPVFPFALLLRLRGTGWPPEPGDRSILEKLMENALSGLGAMPELGAGMDPHVLPLLARRQADALSTGRRSLLLRIGQRLGFPPPASVFAIVPSRMLRPHPLLGWDPVKYGG